jgi:hypothetical protein
MTKEKVERRGRAALVRVVLVVVVDDDDDADDANIDWARPRSAPSAAATLRVHARRLASSLYTVQNRTAPSAGVSGGDAGAGRWGGKGNRRRRLNAD